jgi:hypothetical protein
MSERYLLAALEPLEFTSNPKTSSARVIELLQLNLPASTLKNFHHLQFLINVQNLLQNMCSERIDPRSSRSTLSFEKKIKEGLVPQPALEFFQKYSSTNERISHFSELVSVSIKHVEAKSSGFVSKYCASEKKLLVFLTAYRASKDAKSIEKELYFEDKGDLFIAPLIAQKGSFSAPEEFKELFEQLESLGRNPLKEYKAVAKYRFNRYYDYVKDYGAVDNAVLAYFVCLMLLEDMAMLDKDGGIETVKRLVECESESD